MIIASRRIVLATFLVLLVLTAFAGICAPEKPSFSPLRFEITFHSRLQSVPYTGRVYVMLSEQRDKEPRLSRSWLNPSPLFAVDVEDWHPGTAIQVDERALFHPVKMNALPAKKYAVQAVARRSLDSPSPGRGAGDLYSAVSIQSLAPDRTRVVKLHLDQVVAEESFQETDRVKLVEFISPALSNFHGRDYKMRASIALPKDWQDDADVRYPIVYYITGFGGTHRNIFRIVDMMGDLTEQILLVVPNATSYRGHTVFADSENNGPWGKALIEEFIPHIEAKYHGPKAAKDRYVTGISSGGWSSLWLQLVYPDTFNGCWSIVPDPVDFRDFQRINLYAKNVNMYHDENGKRRPLARRKNRVIIWYDDFVRMEQVLGPGGQIHAFEAVFSPKGADGEPEPLFDRKTGEVDPAVAKSWEAYDINLYLKRNWENLAPKLKGKLHIFAGEADNFYLEGAVTLLKETLQQLGSDADVRIFDGLEHAPPPGVFPKMLKEIMRNFEKDRVDAASSRTNY